MSEGIRDPRDHQHKRQTSRERDFSDSATDDSGTPSTADLEGVKVKVPGVNSVHSAPEFDKDVLSLLMTFNREVNRTTTAGKRYVRKVGGFAVLEELRKFNQVAKQVKEEEMKSLFKALDLKKFAEVNETDIEKMYHHSYLKRIETGNPEHPYRYIYEEPKVKQPAESTVSSGLKKLTDEHPVLMSKLHSASHEEMSGKIKEHRAKQDPNGDTHYKRKGPDWEGKSPEWLHHNRSIGLAEALAKVHASRGLGKDEKHGKTEESRKKYLVLSHMLRHTATDLKNKRDAL